MPQVNEDEPHNAEDNLSPNLLVYSHLSLVIKILLKIVSIEDVRVEIRK